MLYPNSDMARSVAEERLRDCLRKAETKRVLREAGLVQQSRLPRHFCLVLSRVGQWLVVVGRRLEQYATPQIATPADLQRVSKA